MSSGSSDDCEAAVAAMASAARPTCIVKRIALIVSRGVVQDWSSSSVASSVGRRVLLEWDRTCRPRWRRWRGSGRGGKGTRRSDRTIPPRTGGTRDEIKLRCQVPTDAPTATGRDQAAMLQQAGRLPPFHSPVVHVAKEFWPVGL